MKPIDHFQLIFSKKTHQLWQKRIKLIFNYIIETSISQCNRKKNIASRMIGCAEEVGEDEQVEDEHSFLLFECEEQGIIIDQTFK